MTGIFSISIENDKKLTLCSNIGMLVIDALWWEHNGQTMLTLQIQELHFVTLFLHSFHRNTIHKTGIWVLHMTWRECDFDILSEFDKLRVPLLKSLENTFAINWQIWSLFQTNIISSRKNCKFVSHLQAITENIVKLLLVI